MGRRLRKIAASLICALLMFGCFARSESQPSASEGRLVNFSAKDSMNLVKGVLRSDGVLFIRDSDDSLTTLWSSADTTQTFFQSLISGSPRYRYRVEVVPRSANQSEIVVNLFTENIPSDEIERFQASQRLNLFNKFEHLAAKFPPAPSAPRKGGVLFSVLPNEDLKALAKRATGNADNWRQIANDNGLSSPSQVKPFETIWVRNSLLQTSGEVAPTSASH